MTIKETVLLKYQIRKTKKQKSEFRNFVERFAKDNEISCKVEPGRFIFHCDNILLGNIENADIVFTAHYDTCAISPVTNVMFPLNKILYWIYQIYLNLVILVLSVIAMFITCIVTWDQTCILWAFVITASALVLQIMFGFPNKHTANDNTSGVCTVLSLIQSIRDNNNIAFVLFDNEEKGMLGSNCFRRKHKEILNDKLIVNFDCVGDGDNLAFLYSKNAGKDRFITALNETRNFLQKSSKISMRNGYKNFILQETPKIYFPSDQIVFNKGIGISSLRKKGRIWYVGKLHTFRDKVCKEDNIEDIVRIIREVLKRYKT